MLLHWRGLQDNAIEVLRKVLKHCVGITTEINEIAGNSYAYLLDSARHDGALEQPSFAAQTKLSEVSQITEQRFLRPNRQIDATNIDSVI